MKNPSVAIIIVNWNNANDTIDCIQNLQKISYDNFKVFLIDNGSSDDSVQGLKLIKEDRLELIETGKNLGFSGGNNVGIKKALEKKFDYVLLLNNDTTVEPNFLDELMRVAESDEKIGVVGSKIYFHPTPFVDRGIRKNNDNLEENVDGVDRMIGGSGKNNIINKGCGVYDGQNMIWYGGGKFSWLGGGRHLQYCEVDEKPEERESRETEYMTGCAFLIKSKIIEEVGDLCEDFFMYYEDTDWSLRVKKAGYKIMYVPASKVYHKVSRSASKLANSLIHYYHIRNALLLSKRQAPKIILPGIYLWSVFNYLKQIIKLAILPSKRDVSRMIMRGIEDFYRGKFGQYEL